MIDRGKFLFSACRIGNALRKYVHVSYMFPKKVFFLCNLTCNRPFYSAIFWGIPIALWRYGPLGQRNSFGIRYGIPDSTEIFVPSIYPVQRYHHVLLLDIYRIHLCPVYPACRPFLPVGIHGFFIGDTNSTVHTYHTAVFQICHQKISVYYKKCGFKNSKTIILARDMLVCISPSSKLLAGLRYAFFFSKTH